MRSLELAIEYLAGERIIGTAAERAAMTTGWLNVGTLWTQTEDTTTYTGHGTSTNHCVSYDLYSALGDSVASSTWVLRFEHTVTSTFSGTNGDVNVFTGISDLDANTNHQANQDWIGFRLMLSARGTASHGGNSNGYGLVRPHSSNGASPQSGSALNAYGFMGDGTENTKFYIQITKLSGTTYNIAIGTSAGGGQLLSPTVTGFPATTAATGLRYLKFGSSATASAQQPWDGLIENVQFRDGVTTWSGGTLVTPVNVYPKLSNGTLFEESDTGKIYMFDGTSAWNEVT